MSYLKKYQWEIIPRNLPMIRRNCPKCNEKADYINTEKFRVNANKNNIDIWMIYQCQKCKSTWNMPIYERISADDVDRDEYQKFAVNDKELIRKYAFNLSLYTKSKAEIILKDTDYKVIEKDLGSFKSDDKEDDNETTDETAGETIIEISSQYPLDIRVDKLLSCQLAVSRSSIKKLYQKGLIFIKDSKNVLKMKAKDKMEIHLFNETQDLEALRKIV